MAHDPESTLESAMAAGLLPNGVQPCEMRRALASWRRWCLTEARDPNRLSPEAGEAYLGHLREGATPRSANSRFATFQIAAGLAWGPETSSHLALTLRAARVTHKAPPADRWARAGKAVGLLPIDIRPPFIDLLTVSRDAPGTRGVLIWSAARIESVAGSLRRFHDYATKAGLDPVPTAKLCQSWADSQSPEVAAISISTYISHVVDAFEKVLTPGQVYDAAAAVADRWAARSLSEPSRKNKTAGIVPASDLDQLGFELMAEADAAPLRRMTEATLYRDGLLLAMTATLPERARAMSALIVDETVFLEPDGIIRFAIPGAFLKKREAHKPRTTFHASIRRPSLHRALSRWLAVYRPMFDGGDWLWPSRLDQHHGLTGKSLGKIIGDRTEQRLGRRVTIHMVRDCVATEIIEADPVNGAVRASATLGHRDRRVTDEFYIHSNGLASATGWQNAIARRIGTDRKSLII
ncbi:hypothetical protein [Amaricoccus tamworthensis]|uniref:hypothetical protein n=1 Tax=Amaricoccus tamworthensis TaxID=57002 RepID=UPI003C7C6C12